MIKEALQYLVELDKPHIFGQGEYTYCNKNLNIIKDPVIDEFSTYTLSGLLEYCDTIVNEDNKIIIHIAGYNQVNCYSMNVDKWQRRILYTKASPIIKLGFSFGCQFDIEEFIIGLHANFVRDETIDKIIAIVGNITDNEIKNFADDGITQTATVKSGINLKAETQLPPIITLAPYRTFTEIDQPESDFIFRVNKGQNGPKCSLHSCYDNRWKLEAINRIAKWFYEKLLVNSNKEFYTIIA